ncbi:hypothetical protein JTB14_011795 [Gonioctena quinquepunctata]|nr:hypothetical protein JTB14_011795 [Gonioctena quinquepunctata]
MLAGGTENISGYNERNRTFDSPSLALQMGTIIKDAVNTAYSVEIQITEPFSERLEQLKNLIIFIETDWAHEITSEAGQNLTINKLNKPSLIPLAKNIDINSYAILLHIEIIEDHKLYSFSFEKYLRGIIIRRTSNLREDSKDLKAHRELLEVTFCSLLIFNKRRVGELQRITLVDFSKYTDTPKTATDFENMLTESGKILYHSLKRVVVRGRRGRGVPVLFNRETLQSIELIISLRENFKYAKNLYLFALPGSENPIAGTSVMRKHAGKALGDASEATLLTSTKLRKHLATMVQILKMDKNELEQLATFMGHTEKTHAQFYRLPDDIYQTAKVSKLLMMAKTNSIEHYKGKSLSEIEIGENLVEDADEDNNDEEGGILENSEMENGLNIGCSMIRENNKKHKNAEQDIDSQKKKETKRTLIPWTEQQKSHVEEFFRKHIMKKKAPRKHEVLSLIEKYPSILKNKPWNVIEVYVQNQYKKKM